MRIETCPVAIFALLALTLGAGPAPAETVNCTPITALPAVITVQGSYCFTGNLETSTTSGSAIEIATNSVVLDLNGFKLGGLGAGLGTNAIGILAAGRQNITVRNGTVRGFGNGVVLSGGVPPATAQGHVIEDVRADQNTRVGISVVGRGHIVRNNQVVATGGATGAPQAFGILANGFELHVNNNDVIATTVTTGGEAIAIQVAGRDNVIEGNRIANTALPGSGASFGINVPNASTNVLVVNNRIATMTVGVRYEEFATGKFRDNLTSGVTTTFDVGTGVTNAGNNN